MRLCESEDANNQLGSVLTSLVGEHVADKEDQAGNELHELLLDVDFGLPAIFSHPCQQTGEEEAKWLAPNGDFGTRTDQEMPRGIKGS